jgi:hypothetical protein
MDQRQLYRRILLRYFFFGCVTAAIVWMYVSGILSPRGLGIAMAASVVIFFIVTVVLQRKASRDYWTDREQPERAIDETTRKLRNKSIWAQTRLIVILQLSLWFGLWINRANLFSLPMLVGVTINLCFTGLLIRSVFSLRKSLKLTNPQIISPPSGGSN